VRWGLLVGDIQYYSSRVPRCDGDGCIVRNHWALALAQCLIRPIALRWRRYTLCLAPARVGGPRLSIRRLAAREASGHKGAKTALEYFHRNEGAPVLGGDGAEQEHGPGIRRAIDDDVAGGDRSKLLGVNARRALPVEIRGHE
jgi:hypothetical protein